MKKAVCKWSAAFLLGLVAPFSFAGDEGGDAANAVRNAWLTAKLYGNDNDGAALRRVTISKVDDDQFIVLVRSEEHTSELQSR